MTKRSESADGAEQSAPTRLSPDPFSAVLPALAALGAVASIAAINWSNEGKRPDRARARRKAQTALRDLETCCMGLQEIFRRFQRNSKVFGGEGAATAPLKFGIHGPRLSPDDARLYSQLVNDIASMLVLATQNSFDVMCAIEDGEIEPPEAVYFGFGEQQEALNGLFSQRATIRASVDTGARVAAALTGLVRELKTYRVEQRP